MLLPLALLGVTGAALYGARRYTRRRLRRYLAARQGAAPGKDGIIPGAHSIELEGRGDRAALLLHGFGDTPQTLTYLADNLHASGITVCAPLLPGHGRTLHEFDRSSARDWISHALAELDQLLDTHPDVAVIGQSMGGALATIIAARRTDVSAMVLIAPFLEMPTSIRALALTHQFWAPVTTTLPTRGAASILDESERARSLAYGVVTGRLLRELLRIVERAERAARKVRAPTLVVHSRNDHRIPVAAAQAAFERLGAPVKKLVWASDGAHVLTVDHGRLELFALVEEWLRDGDARETAKTRSTAV